MNNEYNESILYLLTQKIQEIKNVDQCVIIYKYNKNQLCLVAYITKHGPINKKEIIDNLKDKIFDLPLYIVEISCIPRTKEGELDKQAISSIPVLDTNLFPFWIEEIRNTFNLQDVALLVEPTVQPLRSYHFKEIKDYIAWNLYNKSTNTQITPKPNYINKVTTNNDFKLKAIVYGGPLLIPKKVPHTLIEALFRTAKKYPRHGITYIGYDESTTFQSYQQLLEDSLRVLTFLQNKGCKSNSCIILNMSSIKDHLTTFWACILGGIIPVTIAPLMHITHDDGGTKKLLSIWEFLEHPPVLCDENIRENMQALLAGKGIVFSLRNYINLSPCKDLYVAYPKDVAFYQTTSGTTATSKCVQITHRGVIAHIFGSRDKYTKKSIILNWLSFDHVVPILAYHLKGLYIGANQINVLTANILSNPLKWLDYIQQYKVTHSWAPNFGFKLVCEAFKKSPINKLDLSSIVSLVNGGEQVTLQVIKEFTTIFKKYGLRDGSIKPAYGMAETCTAISFCTVKDIKLLSNDLFVKNITESDNTARFVDVGPPNLGIAIRIVDKSNNIVPEKVIGRLQIRGDVITPGYLNNIIANKEAFIDEWFDTGDLGFINNGHLTITGRVKEVIIIRGNNFFCHEIEAIVSNIDGVDSMFSAACGVYDTKNGTEELIIFFAPRFDLKKNFNIIQKIRESVSLQIGINASYIIPIPQDQFPKTTSGKIQRNLLKKRFLNGNYDSLCSEIDKFFQQSNTLPFWFYKKTWSRVSLTAVEHTNSIVCMIFTKEENLYLYEDLVKNINCIFVILGKSFKVLEAQKFEINIRDLSTYCSLFKLLKKKKIFITHFLHFGSCEVQYTEYLSIADIKEAHFYGIWSILYILQAVSNVGYISKTHLRLVIFSCQSQSVTEKDPINLSHTSLPSITQIINTEFHNIKAHHVDFSREDLNNSLSEYIRQELHVNIKETEISYRNGFRFAPILHQLDPLQNQVTEVIKNKGLYIITGGLGKVGLSICQYLHNKYQVELIILGRTPQSIFNIEQIKSYNKLKECGCIFSYHDIDLCDLQRIEYVIQTELEKRNKSIEGIFHLAGIYHEQLLVNETIESFEKTFYSKIYGAWNLHQLLHKLNPTGTFVSFSSLISNFSGATLGSYATANRFLESLTVYQRNYSSIKSYSLSWSNWDDVGRAMHSRGFCSIDTLRGTASLGLILAADEPSVLIGLDANNLQIQKYTQSLPYALETLYIYFTAPNKVLIDQYLLLLKDQFGISISYKIIQKTAIPFIKREGDISTLQNGQTKEIRKFVEAETYLEKQITEVWENIFLFKDISIEDNFFDIGGNSLLLIKLHSQLKQKFKVEIRIIDLSHRPTIQSQADLIYQLFSEE